MNPLLKLALEIGPLAVFLIVYTLIKPESLDLVALEALDETARQAAVDAYFELEIDALITTTIVFLAVFAVSMAVSYMIERKVSKIAALTAGIVFATGFLTIVLRDETFIKMKPTLVNAALGATLLVGLLQGRSYLKLVMSELMPMRDEGWIKLARNWTIYFFCMAVLNEIVWRTQPTDVWAAAKLFLYLPLTFGFTISQVPVMTKYAIDDDKDDADHQPTSA